jgi:NAD(P)-dependent dehydrogenase (short-subunit alcohol dehydrogenase family)
MLLKDKVAVVHGAAGAVGSAVARAFAREGARVFLAGRTLASVDRLAREIVREGGQAEAAEVDALDERAVEAHATAVATKGGRIDAAFNAVGIAATEVEAKRMQGTPFVELPLDAFATPIATYTRAHFVIARAAARRMVERRSGVILVHTPEPARIGGPLLGGMAPAWAALEAMTRSLSAELAPHGVRAVGLRTTGLPETATIDVIFGIHAKALGIGRDQFRGFVEGMTHTKRSTTLADLAAAAVFLASDRGRGMTGTVANLTGGLIVD